MARTTLLADQWHVLQVVQGDGVNFAPTHMVEIKGTHQDAPGAFHVGDPPRQRVHYSPKLVTWPQADPNSYNGHDVETTITKQVDTATHRWITSIQSSDRSAIVQTWRTQCLTLPGLAVVYDFSWLSANEHTGQGLNLAEFFLENYPVPADHWLHNPNMGGQGPFLTDVAQHWRRTCGGPIYYKADLVNGVHEACVSPVEFFPGPPPVPVQDHGGSEFQAAHYYLARHYLRVALHYQNNPRLHRTDAWMYWAVQVDESVRPFFSAGGPTLALVNVEFDEVYIRDIQSGVQRQLLPFTGPGGSDDQVTRAFTTNNTLEHLAGVDTFTASDVPSGYACVAFRRSSDDFCVAILMKIFPTNDDVFAQTRLTAAEQCQVFIGSCEKANPPGGPGDRDKQCGSFVNTLNKTTKLRQKGWIGWAQFTYTGAFVDLPATATQAKNDGLLDEPGWQDLPRVVVTGTGFTGVSGVEGPILEELRGE